MLEKNFQRKIIERLKKCNVLCYKFASPAHAGVPDLVCMHRGASLPVFFIEVKRPDGKGRLTKLQQVTIEKMERHGAYVFVVDSMDQVEKIIEDIQQGRPDA